MDDDTVVDLGSYADVPTAFFLSAMLFTKLTLLPVGGGRALVVRRLVYTYFYQCWIHEPMLDILYPATVSRARRGRGTASDISPAVWEVCSSKDLPATTRISVRH